MTRKSTSCRRGQFCRDGKLSQRLGESLSEAEALGQPAQNQYDFENAFKSDITDAEP
jgi:hypothetical protein